MHPAPSIILFTVLSGIGLGYLTFLGLGMPRLSGATALWGYGFGMALTVAGLLSSTFHLGNPQRAPKAFTQWRSSWLSREAWAAAAALAITGLHATVAIFAAQPTAILGFIAAALCLVTVFATAMIYTSIRAVPRWHQAGTPLHFLATALAGGALLAAQPLAATVCLLAALLLHLWVWHHGDGAFARAGTTTGTATGLGSRGAVRAFEPPHTADNYLLREMAFQVGRKHRNRLRVLTIALAYLAPLLLLAVAGGALWASWAGAVIHVTGVLAGRWLFFAEAEHVVGHYYGRRAA